ncbi:MAG: hypothetical protein PF505_02705 [Vallitaleaceae bacterium]|jgi:hypothetical protein|nr:hypothetical protein [Vallitaleaceae bacterium]
MIDLFVRKSGLYDKFYIDYQGQYKIQEISKSLGLDIEALKAMYIS